MKLTPRITFLKPPAKLHHCQPYYANQQNKQKQKIKSSHVTEDLNAGELNISLLKQSNITQSTNQNQTNQNVQESNIQVSKSKLFKKPYINDLTFLTFSQCLTQYNNMPNDFDLVFTQKQLPLKQFYSISTINCKEESNNGYSHNSIAQNWKRSDLIKQNYEHIEKSFNQLVQRQEQNQYLISQLQWKMKQLRKETIFKN